MGASPLKSDTISNPGGLALIEPIRFGFPLPITRRKRLRLDLVLENQQGRRPLAFNYSRMINAGYVGKNQEEVRRHIEELAAKGIPGPASIPVLFPVVCHALTTESEIEVYGGETSGEVEYVLCIVTEDEVYVGLGSDHTDRHLEKTDIPRAKQICPNLMSRTVWPLKEVERHWDDLLMSASVVKAGKQVAYQKGRLGLLLNPAELMSFAKSKIGGPLVHLVLFSGTMGMLTEEFVFGESFSAALVDEHINRRLEISYNVKPLDYLVVE
jgi:hypothetical protein